VWSLLPTAVFLTPPHHGDYDSALGTSRTTPFLRPAALAPSFLVVEATGVLRLRDLPAVLLKTLLNFRLEVVEEGHLRAILLRRARTTHSVAIAAMAPGIVSKRATISISSLRSQLWVER
jgi:hypothetical protein